MISSIVNYTTATRALRFAMTLVGLLFILLSLTGCASREVIAHDLDEREANEILVFLSGRNIEASKDKAEGGGGGGSAIVKWNISVPSEQRNEAMAVLSQAGLPRRATQSLLDLFRDSGLVPSEMQQQIRYRSGLQEQIASIIRKMDGIVDADVQLSFPEEDPLNPNAKKGKVTASVYVKHTGVLNDPNSQLISKIKWLVAGSVPDLNYDNVTVVPDLARYREATPATDEGGMRSADKPLVSIWTMILAKESVTRFRIVFFSFFVSVLILLILFIMLLYRALPAFSATKTSLFSFKRIDAAGLAKKDEPKAADDPTKAGKPAKPAKKPKDEEDEAEHEETEEEET